MMTAHLSRQIPDHGRQPGPAHATAGAFQPTRLWRKITVAAASTVACACIAACASAAPYNPDDLGTAQVARVAEICQSVMGLQPSERPEWGLHPGNPHLELGASHYQGCIASLSDSLQKDTDTDAATQADQDCRAKGLVPNSPDLAVCVLQSIETRPTRATTQSAVLATTSSSETAAPRTVGSFFYASPPEMRRREQLACASLGFEPPNGVFANCVKDLNDTFFAIDNPVE